MIYPVYYPSVVDVVGPPQITVTPTVYWFQPLARVPPVRTKENPNLPKVFFGAPPRITVTPSGYWFQPLPRPPVKTKENVSPKVFFGRPPLITITPSKWDFYQPLSKPPVRTAANASPKWFGIAEPPQITITPTSIGFYQPLSRPPLGTRANLDLSLSFFAFPPVPTATPATWGWYQPLSIPVVQTNRVIWQWQASVILPPSVPDITTVAPGGHWLPLTKKQLQELKKRERAQHKILEDLESARLADGSKAIAAEIMETLYPAPPTPLNDIGIAVEDNEDEEIELLLLSA